MEIAETGNTLHDAARSGDQAARRLWVLQNKADAVGLTPEEDAEMVSLFRSQAVAEGLEPTTIITDPVPVQPVEAPAPELNGLLSYLQQ
jgi:hypothetical protein